MLKTDINLNLYKTFYNVAKIGNITETAKKMYTSQPALSRSIKKLEAELKVQLFFRTPSGMELTEKGKILFNHIEEAYDKIVLAEKELKLDKNLETGKMTIGIPSHIATHYLFNSLSNFHKSYPNIDITIISKTTTQMLKLLKNHEIDFIIDTAPIKADNNNFRVLQLTRYENCFFASKNNNYAKTLKLTSVKDLEEFPLVLPIEDTANRNNLNKIIKENNIKFNTVLNIHTSEMIIGAVKRGLGIGYVMKNLIENDLIRGDLEVINIKETLPTTEVELCYDKKNLNSTALFFIKNYLNINLKI